MHDFSDTLGLGALPGPIEWAPPDTPASLGDFSTGGSADVPPGASPGGLNVAIKPPAGMPPPPTAPAAGPSGLREILGLLQPQQPQGGVLNPNSQFLAALGAGLNAAGQNWNKPALAAFASGAGAALQGGQQWNNQQQDAKLKALHAAIAAWRVGDIGGYYQALALFRALSAPTAGPTR